MASKSKNRNYPNPTLKQALEIPRAIQEQASGMPVNKLTLAEIVRRTPSAGSFRELLLASRAYGLTSGGVNADQFELTALGVEATAEEETVRAAALRKAVMNIEPFRVFLDAYNGKKIPARSAFKDFLAKSAAVPLERTDDCIEHILADVRMASLVRVLKGSEYIDLSNTVLGENTDEGDNEPSERMDDGEIAQDGEVAQERFEDVVPPQRPEHSGGESSQRQTVSKKVFIAHGKNRTPLSQLKKMLDDFKVKYAIAVDEANRGRPVSKKVADLMRDECSSAIFIFTADERFLKESDNGETVEVWRPSENVVYELGAASVLYNRRIVIFKEKRVTFPSDFSDLGYIEFESDQLDAMMGSLFKELVDLDILEVRAKG